MSPKACQRNHRVIATMTPPSKMLKHTQTHANARAHTHKQTNKPKKKGKKHSLQNTPPPVAENSCDVAATQGPQKQMDAKNNTIKRPAKTKEPKKKKANKQLRTAHSEISPC